MHDETEDGPLKQTVSLPMLIRCNSIKSHHQVWAFTLSLKGPLCQHSGSSHSVSEMSVPLHPAFVFIDLRSSGKESSHFSSITVMALSDKYPPLWPCLISIIQPLIQVWSCQSTCVRWSWFSDGAAVWGDAADVAACWSKFLLCCSQHLTAINISTLTVKAKGRT